MTMSKQGICDTWTRSVVSWFVTCHSNAQKTIFFGIEIPGTMPTLGDLASYHATIPPCQPLVNLPIL